VRVGGGGGLSFVIEKKKPRIEDIVQILYFSKD